MYPLMKVPTQSVTKSIFKTSFGYSVTFILTSCRKTVLHVFDTYVAFDIMEKSKFKNN